MKRKILSTFLVASLFVGCGVKSGNAQLENKNISQITQKIVKGKTTKAQIKSLLGEPQGIGIEANGETRWTYSFMKASPTAATYIPVIGGLIGGSKSKINTLTIYFNKKGVVTNYSYMSQKQKTHVTPF